MEGVLDQLKFNGLIKFSFIYKEPTTTATVTLTDFILYGKDPTTIQRKPQQSDDLL